MTSVKASKQLFDIICERDAIVRSAIKDEVAVNNILGIMEQGFSYIVSEYPDLIEDIQERIVSYHTCRDDAGVRDITDFIHLPQWFTWSLKSHPKEWWNKEGEHYQLRLVEIINMYLIAKEFS